MVLSCGGNSLYEFIISFLVITYQLSVNTTQPVHQSSLTGIFQRESFQRLNQTKPKPNLFKPDIYWHKADSQEAIYHRLVYVVNHIFQHSYKDEKLG